MSDRSSIAAVGVAVGQEPRTQHIEYDDSCNTHVYYIGGHMGMGRVGDDQKNTHTSLNYCGDPVNTNTITNITYTNIYMHDNTNDGKDKGANSKQQQKRSQQHSPHSHMVVVMVFTIITLCLILPSPVICSQSLLSSTDASTTPLDTSGYPFNFSSSVCMHLCYH
jgi:hypothetical protein